MGIENGIRMVNSARSPFPSTGVKSASFTLGAEAGDARNIAIQFKTPRYKSVASRVSLRGYLASDANGDSLTPTSPDSLTAGAAGTVLSGAGDGGPGLLVIGTLAITAAAEKFKTTTTAHFMIGGKVYTKAATDNLVFSAAHVVASAKYGIALVQIDAAGTVTTKVPGATQTTPMSYASAAAALAALPAPDAGKARLGYITLDNSTSQGTGAAGAWVAITDDLTDTGDITAAAFVDGSIIGVSRSFDLVSSAAGIVNLIITTTQVVTYYLVIILPDGTRVVSAAIAFT